MKPLDGIFQTHSAEQPTFIYLDFFKWQAKEKLPMLWLKRKKKPETHKDLAMWNQDSRASPKKTKSIQLKMNSCDWRGVQITEVPSPSSQLLLVPCIAGNHC